MSSVDILTIEERAAILEACRRFDETYAQWNAYLARPEVQAQWRATCRRFDETCIQFLAARYLELCKAAAAGERENG